MYVRKKNPDDYISKLRINSGLYKLYWNVYLFKDAHALYRNTRADDDSDEYLGLHRPMPYSIDCATGKPKPKPLIGEIHLIAGEWNLEIIAHELQHALFHLMRVTAGTDILHKDFDDMPAEEVFCYIYGQMLDGLHSQLWKINPPYSYTKE